MQEYLQNHMAKVHRIFFTRCLWPWLGPVAALGYVYTSGFVDDIIVSYKWQHVATAAALLQYVYVLTPLLHGIVVSCPRQCWVPRLDKSF